MGINIFGKQGITSKSTQKDKRKKDNLMKILNNILKHMEN
jgi:hypothetical protein